MKRLRFLDRKSELERLKTALSGKRSVFVAVYGRRRCGKSRLLQEVIGAQDVYFLADQSESPLQRNSLAASASRTIPGFNEVDYPSWEALISAINRQAEKNITLILDEFPYLVQSSFELPSVLQKCLDRGLNFNVVICGSSQKMMQGFVLDSTAPLYGRAQELVKIRPLAAGWISKAFVVDAVAAIETYACWGGVPRYWELAQSFASQKEALINLVFDRNGILHHEPKRLLLDDMRSATQPHSVLSLIANGCHKLTEIAGRLGKPAVNLARPLDNLIELGYIRRDIPWGESTRSTKRSLYRLQDPFIQFWYRFIYPNTSLLEQDLITPVFRQCEKSFPHHVAQIWEALAQESIAKLTIKGISWKPGQRC